MSTTDQTASTQHSTANCTECDATVRLQARPMQGEIVRCSGCGAELEVRSVDPLALELAPQVQEDWGE